MNATSQAKNLEAFNTGITLMKSKIMREMKKVFLDVAKELQEDALNEWDEQGIGLTGNTRSGITSAFYMDGKLVAHHENTDVLETGMVMPGDFGFYDVITGEKIGSDDDPRVFDYSEENIHFISNGQRGKRTPKLAAQIMASYTPPSNQGFHIVVFSAAPYSDFLENYRHLNILTETSQKAERMFKERMSKVKIK